MVDVRGAEILANGLQRAAENFGDAAGVGRERSWGRALAGKIGIGSSGRRPEIQEWPNAGSGGGASGEVGDEGCGGLVKMLAEAFVVGEEKCFVALKRSAGGGAELITLEWRSGTLVEEIWRVESVVAEKFEDGAVPPIGAGLGDDGYLSARALAVFGAIRVALNIEFANGVNAEKHA